MSSDWSANKLLKYFYPIFFFIPMNLFIMSAGIGYGIQWIFFRYQATSLGDSVMPLGRGLFYVLSGVMSGKSIFSEILPLVSALVFFAAFLFVLANRTRLSGLLNCKWYDLTGVFF